MPVTKAEAQQSAIAEIKAREAMNFIAEANTPMSGTLSKLQVDISQCDKPTRDAFTKLNEEFKALGNPAITGNIYAAFARCLPNGKLSKAFNPYELGHLQEFTTQANRLKDQLNQLKGNVTHQLIQNAMATGEEDDSIPDDFVMDVSELAVPSAPPAPSNPLPPYPNFVQLDIPAPILDCVQPPAYTEKAQAQIQVNFYQPQPMTVTPTPLPANRATSSPPKNESPEAQLARIIAEQKAVKDAEEAKEQASIAAFKGDAEKLLAKEELARDHKKKQAEIYQQRLDALYLSRDDKLRTYLYSSAARWLTSDLALRPSISHITKFTPNDLESLKKLTGDDLGRTAYQVAKLFKDKYVEDQFATCATAAGALHKEYEQYLPTEKKSPQLTNPERAASAAPSPKGVGEPVATSKPLFGEPVAIRPINTNFLVPHDPRRLNDSSSVHPRLAIAIDREMVFNAIPSDYSRFVSTVINDVVARKITQELDEEIQRNGTHPEVIQEFAQRYYQRMTECCRIRPNDEAKYPLQNYLAEWALAHYTRAYTQSLVKDSKTSVEANVYRMFYAELLACIAEEDSPVTLTYKIEKNHPSDPYSRFVKLSNHLELPLDGMVRHLDGKPITGPAMDVLLSTYAHHIHEMESTMKQAYIRTGYLYPNEAYHFSYIPQKVRGYFDGQLRVLGHVVVEGCTALSNSLFNLEELADESSQLIPQGHSARVRATYYALHQLQNIAYNLVRQRTLSSDGAAQRFAYQDITERAKELTGEFPAICRDFFENAYRNAP